MIKFYYHPTPNPSKVALMLEESGLDYAMVPVDISRGDQHQPAFRAINPNGKVPALVDDGIAIFDSSAILLHLARKKGRFLGDPTPAGEASLLSWLMFVGTGVGPFTGQAIHFAHYAPEPNPYAAHRYDFEAHRHWQIIEDQLAKQPYLAGQTYSIADMSLWGWCRGLNYLLGDKFGERYPNVARLRAEIDARPAAARVQALARQHAFKVENDAETRAALFRHGTPT